MLFRNTDWQTVYIEICKVNVGWLLVSQVFAWGAYFARAQRWSYIVREAAPASFRNLFSAIQISFLVNFTIPARLGEFVRAYILARLEGLPLSQSIIMVVLDRINDLFGLLCVVAVALLSFPQGQSIELPAELFANELPMVISSSIIKPAVISLLLIFFGAVTVLLLLFLTRDFVFQWIEWTNKGRGKKIYKKLQGIVTNISEGMKIFKSRNKILLSLFFSLIIWLAGVLSLGALFSAFSLPFPWFAPFLGLTLIALFIAIPIAPGMIGQYHIAVIICLLFTMPGIDIDKAKAIAIVGHALTLLPIACLGIFCLIDGNISIFQMKQAVSLQKK